MKPGLMVLAVLFAFACFAKDEFGDLATAKSQHPEFFKPGIVLEASLNGESWYVYCGDAERCFRDETEDELYQEAEVQAKTRFWECFAKKDKSTKVSVMGSRRMYQTADGAMRYVVMGVPKTGVRVTNDTSLAPTATAPSGTDAVVVSTKPDTVAHPKQSVTQSAAVVQTGLEPVPALVPKIDLVTPVQTTRPSAGDDDEKLTILRSRLEKDPDNFSVRVRMARIFARQGKASRALRNYAEAASLIGQREQSGLDDDAVLFMREIAEFEEINGALSLALKHYRILQRSKDAAQVRYSTDRISRLLLKCR